MGKFNYRNLESRVYPPADEIPLANGNGPLVDAPQPQRRSARPLLWVGVIACVIIGARLVAILLFAIMNSLRLAGAPLTIRPAWITVCVSAWVGICLLAIMRAWRHYEP